MPDQIKTFMENKSKQNVCHVTVCTHTHTQYLAVIWDYVVQKGHVWQFMQHRNTQNRKKKQTKHKAQT